VYIANPPLYLLKKGKKEYYAYSEEEREKYMDRFSNGKTGTEGSGIQIQRYKGLGEMNPGQLWKTTMDPDHRTIHQVTVENSTTAEKTFRDLMGDEVQPRKDFINKHAKYVKNLDI
jgi:DNA gyrase subunit B